MPHSDKEGLLSRWSRLKRESSANGDDAGRQSTQPETNAAPDVSAERQTGVREHGADDALPELPSLDALTPDSDFHAFMDPRVDDGVRRAALKTLFRSPDFNLTDGLDVYAEDYTKLEKLTPAMVAALKYAQRTLFDRKDDSADTGLAKPDGRQLADEHRSQVQGETHAQGDGEDHGFRETGAENTAGAGSANAVGEGAGGETGEGLSTGHGAGSNRYTPSTGERRNAVTGEQAGSKRDE